VNQAVALLAPSSAAVHDLLQHRLQHALRQRVRYRYVKPNVLLEDGCYRIQSPCCSRRIDPDGGLIDIALLVPLANGRWHLSWRDHAKQCWVTCSQNEPLGAALDHLCRDPDHRFWP
jgi:hypothetical protein